MKKVFTLEQFAKFCMEKNIISFDSEETGFEVSVQVPARLTYEEDEPLKGMMKTQLKVCHTLLNRNGSYISEENMKEHMGTLKYRPLLGYIHKLDNGEYDFHAHDMYISENDDGEEEIEYLEKQIGAFTEEEPYLEYDEENDKTYVIANAMIPEEYTRATEILRRKKGSKVSCELVIDKFSYNAKEKYIEIEDFYFSGVTCLGSNKNGTEIGEGMIGSRIDIMDFKKEEDVINTQKSSLKKGDVLDIDKNFEEGGGLCVNKKLEELLNKYEKKLEDISFEYENLTDEELEKKFSDEFESDEGADEADPVDETEETEDTEEAEDEAEEAEPEEDEKDEPEEDPVKEEHVLKHTVQVGEQTFSVSVSLNDKIYGLQKLVNATYGEEDNVYYGVTVYDDYLIMHGFWMDAQAYKQSYVDNDGSLSLKGDRVEVHQVWVTDEEEQQLNDLKENYSSLESELKTYKDEKEDLEKLKIFENEDYAEYLEEDEFKTLMENRNKYSVEELTDKLEIAFAKCVRKAGVFSVNKEKKNNRRSIRSALEGFEAESKPYGTLFEKIK